MIGILYPLERTGHVVYIQVQYQHKNSKFTQLDIKVMCN